MSHFAQGYALLIGVDEHRIASWSLPDVTKDLRALQAVLSHPARCAYPAEQVRLLRGEEATRAGILAGLDWLHTQLQNDPTGNATALIYYSGHGWRNQAGVTSTYYLIPHDTQEQQPGVPKTTTALRADEVADAIAALPAKRLLVLLDCCHAAGFNIKTVGGLVNSALPPALFLAPDAQEAATFTAGAKGPARLAAGDGRAILSSAQADQQSYIRKDRRMSIFTYHLIEALTGHAQPQTGAGEVLVSDILSYLHRTVATSAQDQHQLPQQPAYQLTGNFPVALLLGGKGIGAGQAPPDPLTLPPAPSALPQAANHDAGATAQEESTAAGERGIAISGTVADSTLVTGDGNTIDQRRTAFDQRGQHVGSQTNITGNVHLTGGRVDNRAVNTGGGAYVGGNVNTGGGDFVGRDKIVGAGAGQPGLVAGLHKLRSAINRAGEEGVLDEDHAIDADGALRKALRLAEQPAPDRQTIRQHLATARALVAPSPRAKALLSALDALLQLAR